MKKLLAALLAVVMTVQLAVPAWAVDSEDTGDTVSYTEPSETPVPEPSEAPAVDPTAEPSAEPTVEPTEEPQAQVVRVRFVCTPEELTLAVYPAEGDVEQLILPEEDGSYLLAPGTYTYLAAAEGYETAEGSFTVEEAAEEQSVEIVLTAAASEADTLEDTTDSSVVASGTCGDNLTWKLTDDGTLTISGTGDMDTGTKDYNTGHGLYWLDDYAVENYHAPWYNDNLNIKTIVIKNGVTNIGINAFAGCKNLTSITIPASVTSIGDVAFNDCNSLISISMPEGVTSIGKYAFFGCTHLASVSIPVSVTFINTFAFDGCNNLTEITFGHKRSDPLYISYHAFYTTNQILTTVRIPSKLHVNPIIAGGFSEAYGARTITFESTGNYPLQGIALATKDGAAEYELGLPVELVVTLDPEDTTENYAVEIVPEKTTAEARVSKNNVITTLTTGTVTVRAYCVENPAVSCELTVTVTQPTGAFESFSITTFNDYPGEAEVGKDVRMMPTFTPLNAAERTLTWSVENGTGTATIDENGVLTPLTTGTVTVYAAAVNGTEASCTVNIVRYIEDITILVNGKTDVDRLGVGESVALSAVLSPEDATAQDVTWSVENGDGQAYTEYRTRYVETSNGYHIERKFYSLYGSDAGTVTLVATANDSKEVVAKKEMTVTDTVRSYALPDGSGSIYYNTETGFIVRADSTVRDVLIPAQIDGVTIVGIAQNVFAHKSYGRDDDNTTLTSVSIPNTVTEIGEYAFNSCTALTTVRFASGSSLRTIGERAFYGCYSIASLTVPDSVQTIGAYAFSGCSGIVTLVIPDSVQTIGKGAFYFDYGDGKLKNLTMPGDLNPKSFLRFYNTLDSLTLTGTFVSGPDTDDRWMGDYRNAKCVTVSEGVTRIEAYAFSSCNGIVELLLPDSLQTIGENAFSGCDNIVKLSLPDSLQSIGKNAFSYCNSLEYFDLSAIPDVITAKETPLKNTVAVPPVLIRTTGGKVQLRWSIDSVDDGNPWDIATLMSDSGGGSSASGNNCRLYARSAGKVRLTCYDEYTGLGGSKIIEIKAGNELRPADTSYLVSGKKVTLSVWAVPSNVKLSVRWELAAGDEAYASLTSSGVLTAKTVDQSRQITVTAYPNDGSDTVTKTFWIIPKATGVELQMNDKPVTGTIQMDMCVFDPTLHLTAVTYPTDAADNVKWTSSAPKIASVDENGIVRPLKPGKAVIKAATQDGSGKTAQITVDVYYLDPGKKLTLVAEDMPAIGLQPGQQVVLKVNGEIHEIPRDFLEYTVSSSAMGSVYDSYHFTAGNTSGTVTVTATFKGDPLNRKASISLKIIPIQAEKIELTPYLYDGLNATLIDFDGEPMVIFDRADLTETKDFWMNVNTFDYRGYLTSTKYKVTSRDTSIATVTSDNTVVVKPGASGTTAIEVTGQDLTKVVGRIWVQVRDYSPRLASTALTVNTALDSGVDVGLVESFENAVTAVSLSDERFTAAYDNNVLTVKTAEAVKNGTYKMTLTAECANGKTYDYAITVKVTKTFPSVTVKQTEKFNLFYTDSTAALTVTVPNQTVEAVELLDCDFALTEGEGGQLRLAYADPYNVPAKPDTKGTLCVTLAGYSEPVTKAITVATVSTAPALKLSTASSTVNTALKTDHSTAVQLLSKTGAVQDVSELNIWTETDGVDVMTADNCIILTPTADKTVTVSIYVQGDTWTKSVKLTHKITVTNKLPTLKPAASTIKLSRVFTAQTAETTLVLSQQNLSLQGAEITPVAKDGTAARIESDKLSLYYEDGKIVAAIADENNAPKAGTYSFTVKGTLEDGTVISGGTIKVTVTATAPTVRLSAASAKLNRYLAGSERTSIKVTLTNGAGYTVTDFEELPDGMSYDAETGLLTVSLPDESSTGGTYKLKAIVRDNTTMQEVTLPTAVTFKVTTYTSNKLSVSLSASGKLDTMNPNSAIVYKINKINNCLGTVEGVALAGADADKFHAELDTTGAAPVIRLTMLDGQQYATNVTYKVQFNLSVCGQDVLSPVMSVRVTQSALKLKAATTVTLYQSQTKRLENTITITSPMTATIADVQLNTAKTPALFLNAIGGESGFAAVINGNTASISFTTSASAKLRAGSSYKIVLDVTPANCTANIKPTQITITVKVMK